MKQVGNGNRNVRLEARSWVYFAQEPAQGLIKIGRTRQLAARANALNYSTPGGIKMLGRLPETDVSEARLHSLFAKHRVHGEWFKPAPAILELAAASGRVYYNGYSLIIEDDADYEVIRRAR